MKRAFKTGMAGGAVIAMVGAPNMAVPEVDTTLNLFGRPGLIDLPSAEVLNDGDIAATITRFSGQTRATLSFQIAPRLTGSFRYSQIDDFFGPGDDLFDRSFDLSYQILTETRNRPALSIGLRDFIGTGVFSSEYIVATKSFGDRLKVTGGLGWGRLGSSGSLGAPFGSRPPLDFGEGGTLTQDQWFRGDVALFGGVEYAVNDKLTVTAEYSSDAYEREDELGLFDPETQVNLGLSYRFDNGGVLSGYYLYGDAIGVSYSFVLNPKTNGAPTGLEPAPTPLNPRPSRSADPEAYEADWVVDTAQIERGEAAIGAALAKEGQVLDAITLEATTARVTIRNRRYGAHPEAIGRTARILARALPASIEVFEITLADDFGLPSTTTILRRSDLERLEFAGSDALLPRVAFADSVGRISTERFESEAPRLTWSLDPGISVSLFDPNEPVRGNVTLNLTGRYEVAPGLVAKGAVGTTLFGSFDNIEEPPVSPVPIVRSNIGQFQGGVRISSATLAWSARPFTNVYSRVTAGLLETQFGGVAGEMLWYPVDSRLALGAELAYARARDTSGAFGFDDFDILTGHASAYYDLGGGYTGQLDVGRYLAGDVGATLTLSREFDNGWVVGAFATRTDVSFEDFGEGSFDKGLRVVVPLDWVLGKPTRTRADATLRSLTRDGGARLIVPDRLYESIRETREIELSDRWGRFWR